MPPPGLACSVRRAVGAVLVSCQTQGRPGLDASGVLPSWLPVEGRALFPKEPLPGAVGTALCPAQGFPCLTQARVWLPGRRVHDPHEWPIPWAPARW